MPNGPTGVTRKLRDTLGKEAAHIGFRLQPTLVVSCAAFVWLLPQYHKKANFFRGLMAAIGGAELPDTLNRFGINYALIVQVGLPIVLILAMREKPRDYGLGLGDKKLGLKMCAIFYLLYIPCFIVLLMDEGFRDHYAFVTKRYATWGQFLGREVLFVSMLCLRNEFLYRGFLLFGIKKHYGAYAGILVQLMPYVLVHSGKAEMEALGSLPVGLALGYLAVRTGSIWYGALLHGSIALLFNATILFMHFHGQ